MILNSNNNCWWGGKKDSRYLLVQETKEKCRGKWSIHSDHLECNETIFEGAKREIVEE